MCFAEPASYRFGVANVPRSAHWGRNTDGVDNSRFFCLDDEPLTVWLSGTLATMWFQDIRGVLQERASVGLNLFREEDVDSAVRLLAMSNPVKRTRPSRSPYSFQLTCL